MIDQTPKSVRRVVLLGHLSRLAKETNTLARAVSIWRDEETPFTPDKPFYRVIGRRLDKALDEIEKALERLKT